MMNQHTFPLRFIGLSLFFGLLSLLLAACGGSGSSGSVELPLAENKPTFLFFWTDN